MQQKKNNSLKTPILYMVFNRLDTIKETINEIRKAKPEKFFIAADGPRTPQEKIKTDEVRKYILEHIDWKCKVKTLFRDKNLGCGGAVSSAIKWFFENVEYGIILEDDCFPSQSFFKFCEELLVKYKDDERIMQISGTNVEGVSRIKEDYFFAINFNVWGWASWRRAWKYYDYKVRDWPRFLREGRADDFTNGKLDKYLFIRTYNMMYRGEIDTWDYQWWLNCATNNGLCIIPKCNLIKNIGLGKGIHMGYSDNKKSLKTRYIYFPLIHNRFIMNSPSYQISCNKFFRQGFLKRQALKLLKKIKKINGKKNNTN
jgi:hypothetical protein